MKMFLLITCLATAAHAQIYFKSVPLCTSWSYANGGYVCSGFPMSQGIPDQFSLNNKIINLESRIQALEAKMLQMQLEKDQIK